MKTYFKAVTFSGSTCACRAQRYISNECTHKHKTEVAAYACLHKLQNWSDDCQSCSATWYYGAIQEFERSSNCQVVDDYDFNTGLNLKSLAKDACRC